MHQGAKGHGTGDHTTAPILAKLPVRTMAAPPRPDRHGLAVMGWSSWAGWGPDHPPSHHRLHLPAFMTAPPWPSWAGWGPGHPPFSRPASPPAEMPAFQVPTFAVPGVPSAPLAGSGKGMTKRILCKKRLPGTRWESDVSSCASCEECRVTSCQLCMPEDHPRHGWGLIRQFVSKTLELAPGGASRHPLEMWVSFVVAHTTGA